MAKLTPEQRVQLAYDTEKRLGLPKGMLVAQLNTESSNGKNNYNPTSGATGPMQFMPATAQGLGIDPNDDEQAIPAAGKVMADNLKQAGGNPAKALELYYAGSPKGIGPKSQAYVGQVGSKWNPDDAFEAAMSGNKQVPDQAPGAPATPDNGAPDYGKAFDTAMTGSNPAPSQAAPPQPEDPLVSGLKSGMQQISDTTHSPYQVERYVRESGYDPSTMQNLEPAVQTGGHLHFGHFDPQPLQHTTGNDLLAGVERGASDVTGSIRGFASYMDQKFPTLAAFDRTIGQAVPAFDPQNMANDVNSNILARRAYDQNFGSVASGAGRLGAQVALTAPFFGAVGRAATAVMPESIAPALRFVSGGAGKPVLDEAGNIAQAGNNIIRGGSLAAAGTTMGAAGNALTSASSDEPFWQHVAHGAEAGAVLGPAVGAAGSAINSVTSRVAPGVDAATAKLAQLAQEKYGFNLNGDQITNSPLVRKVSAMMNLNPVNNNLARDAEQHAQFSRAVGQTFGATAPDGVLSPEVMNTARKNIGATLDDIAARNPVHVDDELLTDLGNIEHTYASSVTDQEMAPIKRNLDNILSSAKEGDTITGETYQRLTAKGSPLDVAMGSANPSIRGAAIEMRGALDDALERSASAAGRGADVQALRSARLQWKNMKTVEPLVSKSPDNMVSPSLLNNRVSVVFKNRAYQGAGDLDELAQIGKKFLTPPSTSGTPEGIRAQRILEGAGTGAALSAAAIGHAVGYPGVGDLAGLSIFAGKRAAGGATNAILRRVFQSEAYKNRLLGGALDANVPTSVNGLPGPLMLTGNRLLQNTMLPPPQPQATQP